MLNLFYTFAIYAGFLTFLFVIFPSKYFEKKLSKYISLKDDTAEIDKDLKSQLSNVKDNKI